MERLHILVFGAGAIGTYIGGSLGLAGHAITFLERTDVVQQLRERGLRLELPGSRGKAKETGTASFTLPPASFSCVSSLDEALQNGPFDAAIFALKSFDTDAALDGMQPFSGQMPPVLCLQNGVDNESALSVVLGPQKVIAGTVTSSVGRRAAGDIVLERLRGVGLAAHPLSARLCAAFNTAGLNAQIFERPADMKWSKMLTNLPANATSAILDMTPAEVFAHPGLFRLEMRMMGEALAVMKAGRINVVNLPGTPVRALAWGAKLPEFIARPLLQKAIGGGRGGKMPSFHIDLHSGRGKSEVEWLNGAVVHYGAELGIPTPVNKALTEILLRLIRGQAKLESYARLPEKLLAEVEG